MVLDQLGDWHPLLAEEFSLPYWGELTEKVAQARKEGLVFPPKNQVFRGFSLTQPAQVRVVILGQDPYHGVGQATGLAFSVPDSVPMPPSLRNIFQELSGDLGVTPPTSTDLTHWAQQGVLLLNPVLTVSQGKPGSHGNFGWQRFTDQVMAKIATFPQPIAFVLWGKLAEKKSPVAKNSPHPRLVLTAPHPSPLSAYRGFFGSRPFSKINQFLSQQGETPIDWVGN